MGARYVHVSAINRSLGERKMDQNQQMDEATRRELQELLQVENQKVQFQEQVTGMSEKCWDLCIGKPGATLSSGEKACIENCVGRFLDTTVFIVNRFQKMRSDA